MIDHKETNEKHGFKGGKKVVFQGQKIEQQEHQSTLIIDTKKSNFRTSSLFFGD